jgi:hypothetical protein
MVEKLLRLMSVGSIHYKAAKNVVFCFKFFVEIQNDITTLPFCLGHSYSNADAATNITLFLSKSDATITTNTTIIFGAKMIQQ